jgi:integrase
MARGITKATGNWAPRDRFHDMRHFCASTLIEAGLHPKVIQEWLGHATIAETMDRPGPR